MYNEHLSSETLNQFVYVRVDTHSKEKTLLNNVNM